MASCVILFSDYPVTSSSVTAFTSVIPGIKFVLENLLMMASSLIYRLAEWKIYGANKRFLGYYSMYVIHHPTIALYCDNFSVYRVAHVFILDEI